MKPTIEELFSLIKKRKAEMPKDSYTTSLFEGGENKIIKKLGEEFTELVMAASKGDKKEFIYESADFIYHFLVLANFIDVTLNDIYTELERRK